MSYKRIFLLLLMVHSIKSMEFEFSDSGPVEEPSDLKSVTNNLLKNTTVKADIVYALFETQKLNKKIYTTSNVKTCHNFSHNTYNYNIYYESNQAVLYRNHQRVVTLDKFPTERSFAGAFSRDCTRLALSLHNDHVHIYSTATGLLERSIQLSGEIVALAYAENDNILITSDASRVVIWDIAVQAPEPLYKMDFDCARYLEMESRSGLVLSRDGRSFTVFDLTELLDTYSSLEKNLSDSQKMVVCALWNHKSGRRTIANIEDFFSVYRKIFSPAIGALFDYLYVGGVQSFD